ncbi:MAG: phosphoenolpyruvate-utilizing N-terminal domain-containing protein, partial [Acidobacteriota bacterium]
MLNNLIHILRKASLAANREEALDLVLDWVAKNMDAEGVILYLRRSGSRDLAPIAVLGMKKAPPPGPARQVAERREPIRLNRRGADAPSSRGHDRRTDSFKAYLGVPIVRLRKVLGVLEVQRKSRKPFSDDDTSLLLTLCAQLAGLILESAPAPGPLFEGQKVYYGTPAAPGLAIGTAVIPSAATALEAVPDRPARDPEGEIEELKQALRAVQAELSSGNAEMAARLPEEIRALYGVYQMILDDEAFISEMVGHIRSGQWAPAALRDTVQALAGRFDAMDDEYLRTRAEDVRAVGRRILLHLQYDRSGPGEFPQRTVLLGKGVGLTCITAVPAERLVGLV